MRTITRTATTLMLGLALVAGACSSGGDAAETTPITPIPAAASPDAAGPDLTDFLTAPEAASTTVTTSAVDRAEAENYVREFLTLYFEASAARDWDAVYEASSQAFAGVCPAEEYAQLTSSFAADPSVIEFVGEFEVSVVGDFATGRVEIADEGGTLPSKVSSPSLNRTAGGSPSIRVTSPAR